MKKTIASMLIALLATSSGYAETGDGAEASSKAVKNNTWQIWAFAAGATVAAAVAITLVAIHEGASPQH